MSEEKYRKLLKIKKKRLLIEIEYVYENVRKYFTFIFPFFYMNILPAKEKRIQV